MLTKIQKWGNSLGLRIPKSFADEAHVRQGSTVDLAVRDGQLVIKPILRPTFDLEELLSHVSKSNVHDEIDAGSPLGREAW